MDGGRMMDGWWTDGGWMSGGVPVQKRQREPESSMSEVGLLRHNLAGGGIGGPE